MKPAMHSQAILPKASVSGVTQGLAQPCQGSRAALAGFTMVEIALSLAIIAFALVAIIGVLPTGIKVQQENREETAINQDALFLIEAIRSGSRGLDDLTNFVESITVDSLSAGRQSSVTYTNGRPASSMLPLINGQQIVGLLSTPRLENANGQVRENVVTARIKSMGGLVSRRSKTQDDFAFRYRLRSEVTPFFPAVVSANFSSLAQAEALKNNLYDLRLSLSWPLFKSGNGWEVGNNRKTFRTLISAELRRTNLVSSPLYFFQPNSFISYP